MFVPHFVDAMMDESADRQVVKEQLGLQSTTMMAVAAPLKALNGECCDANVLP
jgi:hypothetical protein